MGRNLFWRIVIKADIIAMVKNIRLPVKIIAGLLFMMCIAQIEGQVSTDYTIDWQNKLLIVSASTPIETNTRNRPTAIPQATRALENQMISLLAQGILNVTIDSDQKLRDMEYASRILAQKIDDIYQLRKINYSSFSEDLKSVQISYHFPLNASIVPIMQLQGYPRPVPRRLGWVPQANYSGIIIFADHQEISGAMFPSVRTVDDLIVFDKSMVAREIILEDGMVLYHTNPSAPEVIERVGNFPLLIATAGHYGKIPSDIIITSRDAHRILSQPSTRSALASGKVVIILPEDRITDRY